jgi:predicted Zn-dependent peptidase
MYDSALIVSFIRYFIKFMPRLLKSFPLSIGFFVAALITSSSSLADQPSTIDEPLARFEEGVTKFVLPNGIRVVHFRRSNAPVFAAQTWVKVGSVDEPIGVSGVSHMLEHMAFKGTKTIGTKNYAKEKKLLDQLNTLVEEHGGVIDAEISDEYQNIQQQLSEIWVDEEFSRLFQERGAQGLNAGTSNDYTMYMVSLPNVAFEFWCWMESERLLNPVFRQFYKERDVVREERRMRVDDNPGGLLYEAMLASSYWSHANRTPTIGWPSDVEHLTESDLENLYQTYYVPENMVISIVGDVDIDEVKKLVSKYFGRIPQAKKEIPAVRTKEVPQKGMRDIVVEFDASPSFVMAFHKPVFPDPDDAKFAVLHELLGGGRSSIFETELVQKKQLAAGIETSEGPGERFPSLFYVYAVPHNNVSNKELAREVQKILNSLKTKKISNKEISAAIKRIKVAFYGGLASNYGLARALADSELIFGDWKKMFELYEQVFKTNADDLQSIAKKYLTESNKTLVRLEKPASTKNKLSN